MGRLCITATHKLRPPMQSGHLCNAATRALRPRHLDPHRYMLRSPLRLFDSLVVTCSNGATINMSGVADCPDTGSKVIGNWIFGSKGMLNYSGVAGGVRGGDEEAAAAAASAASGDAGPCLELYRADGKRVRKVGLEPRASSLHGKPPARQAACTARSVPTMCVLHGHARSVVPPFETRCRLA